MIDVPRPNWSYMAIARALNGQISVHGFDTIGELNQFIGDNFRDYGSIRAIRYEELQVQLTCSLTPMEAKP